MTKEATNYRKTHVSMRGKSDKQQKHFVQYEVSHQDGKLERWYKKITTPKVDNRVKKPKASVSVRVYKEPYGVPKKKPYVMNQRDLTRLAKFKRDTHWVARSEEEYIQMHSH